MTVAATMLQVCGGHDARIASLFSFHHRDARTGDRRRLGVMRIAGGDMPDAVVDAVWKSCHHVRRAASDDADATG